MLVVDASATLISARAAAADDIERQVAAHDYALHAPHLLDEQHVHTPVCTSSSSAETRGSAPVGRCSTCPAG